MGLLVVTFNKALSSPIHKVTPFATYQWPVSLSRDNVIKEVSFPYFRLQYLPRLPYRSLQANLSYISRSIVLDEKDDTYRNLDIRLN